MSDLYEIEDSGNWWDFVARYMIRRNGYPIDAAGTLSGARYKIAARRAREAERERRAMMPKEPPNIVYREQY